jgi:hypothetical protein
MKQHERDMLWAIISDEVKNFPNTDRFELANRIMAAMERFIPVEAEEEPTEERTASESS